MTFLGMSGRQYRSCRVIAAREIYDHVHNPLVWALVLFAALLAGSGTRVGLEGFRTRSLAYDEFVSQRAQDRQRNAGQLTSWQVQPGLRAIRPPAPAYVIVSGLDDALPQFWDFGPAGVRTGPTHLGAGDSPNVVDLEFIVRIALGLLAILLAMESVAGERASGALRALLGQPVTSNVVLIGKLVGASVALGGAIALVLGVMLATVFVSRPDLFTGPFVGAALGIGAIGWLYLFIYFTFGVVVSSALASYRGALTAAAIIWLIGGATGVTVPQVVAQSLAPMLPTSRIERQADAILAAETRQVQTEMGDRYLAALPDPASWTNPLDPKMEASVLAQLEPVWQQHVGRLRRQLDAIWTEQQTADLRRRRLSSVLRLASPGAQFAAAVSNVTDTGDALAQQWSDSVRDYQATLDAVLFDTPARLTMFVPGEPKRGPAIDRRWIVSLKRGDPPSLSDLPSFRPPESRLRGRLLAAAVPIAVLLLNAVVLIVAATITFRRIRL